MKKHTESINKNGITLKNDISLSIVGQCSWDSIFLVLLAVLGTLGAMGCYFTVFLDGMDSINRKLILTAVYAAIFSLSFLAPKKLRFLPLALLAIGVFSIVLSYDEAEIGFKNCFNMVLDKTKLVNKGYKPYRLRTNETFGTYMGDYYVSVFVDDVIFAVSYLTSFLVMKTKQFLPVFALTFPFVEISLAFGLVPSYSFFFTTVSFWIAMVCVNFASFTHSIRGRGTNFIKHGNTFIPKSNIKCKLPGISGMISFGLSFVLLVAICFGVKISDYKRSEEVNELRMLLTTSTKTLSVNDIMNIFADDTPVVFIPSSGEMGQLDTLSYRNQTVMKVSIQNNKLKSPIYLRGNVFSVYLNNSWKSFDESFYDTKRSLFNSIESSGVNPLDVYGKNMYLNNSTEAMELTISDVKYKGAPSYVPYGTSFQIGSYVHDTVMNPNKSNGKYSSTFTSPMYFPTDSSDTSVYEYDLRNYIRTHSFNVSDEAVPWIDKYNTITESLSNTYYDDTYDYSISDLTLQQKVDRGLSPAWLLDYNDYLRNYCGFFPDSAEMRAVRDAFAEDIENAQNANSIYMALAIIRDSLQRECKYSLSPGKVPNGRDLVEYFLLENKKGYCVYFASAGVLLCRMAGIPCRYVEGYVINSDDYSSAVLTDLGYTMDIKDNRAHAWAEIYLPELGWVPFEFTPGYSSDEPEPETTESPEDTTTSATTTTSQATTSTTEAHTTALTTPDGIAPAVTTTESSGGGTEMPRQVQYSVIVLIIILLATICWMLLTYFKGKRIYARRMALFNSKKQTERTVSAFEYINNALEYLNVSRASSQTYADFTHDVEENSNVFASGEYRKATRIAEKAFFSHHKVSEDEADCVVALAKRLSERLVESSSFFKRLYVRYILNL